MDQDRGPAVHSRDRRGESQPCRDDHREDRHADLDVKAQQGVPQEERASDLLRDGSGLDGGRLRHDRGDAKEGYHKDLGDLRASGVRANGIWETLPADLFRDVPLRPGLLRVGQDNAQGGRLLPSSGTLRSLAVDEASHGDLSPAEDVPGGTVPAGEPDDCCQLSSTAASALAYKSQSIIPRTFNELLGKERPRLLEVACSPDSVLSRTFQEKLGCEDCAVRCSFWNGADLTKPVGLQLVLEQIRSLNPLHVWLTTVWPVLPHAAYQPTYCGTAC